MVLPLPWRVVLASIAASACTPHLGAQTYAFTTLAGTPSSGSADGPGANAKFNAPEGVAVDPSGNVYVADTFNGTIRKIAADGTVSTYAGLAGYAEYVDGDASVARLGSAFGLVADHAGNVYFTDGTYATVRRISATGAVTTVAGSPGKTGSSDGVGSAARFVNPTGIAVDSAGNLFVTDPGTYTIRKVAAGGVVTTFAGLAGTPGSADGIGTNARFRDPFGIAIDAADNLYVTDFDDCTIRKIDSQGNVSTFAGLAGAAGTTNGSLASARFDAPAGISIDAAGFLFVADRTGEDIRIISPAGQVATLAGQLLYRGYVDGPVASARFDHPTGVAVDSLDRIYIADTYNCEIRRIDSTLNVTTIAGSVGAGSADGIGTNARLFLPRNIAFDSHGNLFISDTYNHTIRQLSSDGTMTTIAGSPGVQGSIDGTAASARFRYPTGLAFDATGNLYVADNTNFTIRKITPNGLVGTLAGLAQTRGSDDGIGSAARFAGPTDVKVDSDGNVIVVDAGNNTLRKITPDGTVTTIAGVAGAVGTTDGPAAAARFNSPTNIALDRDGTIYIADSGNNVIRKLTRAGMVSTLAGLAGVSGSADGTAGAARFTFPFGIAVDADGNVFVADEGNQRIRKITPTGTVTTVGGYYLGAANGIGSAALFWDPSGLAIDSVGNLYVADQVNDAIRKGGQVNVATPTSRLFNLSVRANLVANNRLITGFVVSGGSKTILIRGIGPGLTPYVGGQTVAADPRLEVYDSALNLEASNDDWGGGDTLRTAFASVGAFPLDPASHDAALTINLTGLHTAHMISNASGVALVEAYDTGSGTTARLINVSARYTVGNGSPLIAGFVIDGTNQKTLLIRGVGPTLSSFGVTDSLTDPHLDIYNAANQRIAGNDDWAPSLATTFTQVGAFQLSNTKDAALLISLSPGLYSAQVSGNGSETGEGLVEIYDVGN